MLAEPFMLSQFSRVRLCTPMDRNLPGSSFTRQEYWRGLHCPPSGHLPDPGMELASLTSPALADGFFTTSTTNHAPSKDSGRGGSLTLILPEAYQPFWLACRCITPISCLQHHTAVFYIFVYIFLFL